MSVKWRGTKMRTKWRRRKRQRLEWEVEGKENERKQFGKNAIRRYTAGVQSEGDRTEKTKKDIKPQRTGQPPAA